jgi:DNA repair exonuclease SbcCD nuclease subunit
MKFLHAADVHIDSPLKGCSFEDSSAADRLRLATRTALANLISLAIEREVDFIIIAGDLFEGAWHYMLTGLWTAEKFRRLR